MIVKALALLLAIPLMGYGQTKNEKVLPLSQQEQLTLRILSNEVSLKAEKKQLKDILKQNHDNRKLNTYLSKVRKAHGWDESVTIEERGNTIVGVKNEAGQPDNQGSTSK